MMNQWIWLGPVVQLYHTPIASWVLGALGALGPVVQVLSLEVPGWKRWLLLTYYQNYDA